MQVVQVWSIRSTRPLRVMPPKLTGKALLERWRTFIEEHKSAPTESGGAGLALARCTREKLAAGQLSKYEIAELNRLKGEACRSSSTNSGDAHPAVAPGVGAEHGAAAPHWSSGGAHPADISDCGCDCGDFTADQVIYEDEANRGEVLCCSCTCCGPVRCDENGNANRQCTVRLHPIALAMTAISRGIPLQEDVALTVPVLCGDCRDHEHTVRLRATVKIMQAKRRRERGDVD